MLVERILTALVLLVPVVGIMLVGGWPLIALAVLCFGIINYEFFSFAATSRRERGLQLVLCSLLLPFGFLCWGLPGMSGGLVLAVVLVLLVSILDVEAQRHQGDYQRFLPGAFVGLGYTGVLGSCLVIAAAELPGALLLWLLLGVMGADTFAYFGGRAFGGPKLAPRISPNKTVSGGLCGLVGAVAGIWLGSLIFGFPFGIVRIIAFGVLVGVMAIFGDLAESLLKRLYEVKDAGSLLPGHGGLLDRVDALLFAVPVLFLV
ncbi:MAG: phosphatidate cytidylyltransferase [Bdellovibrionales bacterium]|nr:phosphatidate cytidylyltransferase [Bdellovibrionales bacterium]